MTQHRIVRSPKRRLALAALAASVMASLALPFAFAGEFPSAASGSPGTVTPAVETQPEFDDTAGGEADADDPAIWVHPDRADDSIVLGTLKNAGLSVFDLDGEQIQRIAAPAAPGPEDEPGRFNNVAVLQKASLGRAKRDIAVVTDRGRDQLRIFAISPDAAEKKTQPLTDITDPASPFLFSKDQAEVNKQFNAYGLALFERKKEVYALVSREHTPTLGLFRLQARADGSVGYERVRTADMPTTFDLPDGTTFTPCEDPGEAPQQEGLVVDAEEGVAYIGQEQVGLWRVDATLKSFEPQLIDKAKEFGVPATFNPETEECEVSGPDPGFGGKNLSTDVEGVALVETDDDEGFLVVSSQGNNSYAVYQRAGENEFVGRFTTANGQGDVDATEETDGLDVANAPLGRFGKGLLVLADGKNTPDVPGEAGEPRDNTNFKFVGLDDVAAAFDPPLDIETD
ncbi:phytase [Streptomyces sp. NPDC048479]|uniref:phytase n=1 Tax=Streptomyces sp. NPDC048479 TaxID=3154725 RepID=UPI00343B987E